MTAPGESEFSWGAGMSPPQERGYELTEYDRLVMIRQTDTTNPLASEEATRAVPPKASQWNSKGKFIPGDMRPECTPVVTEKGPSSRSGQHTPIDVNTYTLGHEPDGDQTIAGRRWRESQPPNPVGELHTSPVFGGAFDVPDGDGA